MNPFPTTKLKAILVDMDGTLANAMDLLYYCYEALLEKYGLTGSREEFEELIGPSGPEIIHILNSRYAMTPTDERLLEEYEQCLDEVYTQKVPLFPGAKQFLECVKKQGWMLVLVTSASQRMAREFLHRHNLTKLFDAVITPEGLPHSKPSPAIYQRALAALSLSPDQTIAIEDSLNGVTASLGAGIPTFHIMHHMSQCPFPGTFPAYGWRDMIQQLIPYRFIAINHSFKVTLVSSQHQPHPTEIEEEIETVWEEQKQIMGDRLFNGKILSLVSFDDHELRGEFRDYRDYLAQIYAPHLRESIQLTTVSVSGITFAGDEVLFGRRNRFLSESRGLIELVPSGSIDPSCEHQGTIDVLRQARLEFTEEAGLPEEAMTSLTPFALAVSPTEDIYEICVRIEIDPKDKERVHSLHGEYDELFWVRLSELPNFLEGHRQEIVPLSCAIGKRF